MGTANFQPNQIREPLTNQGLGVTVIVKHKLIINKNKTKILKNKGINNES